MIATAILKYQRCSLCDAVWYFERQFCPYCGERDPTVLTASGRGTVYARTLVLRPPSAELEHLVPYLIVLVDTEEGFRVMGHGSRDLQIDDVVGLAPYEFAGRVFAYFERHS